MPETRPVLILAAAAWAVAASGILAQDPPPLPSGGAPPTAPCRVALTSAGSETSGSYAAPGGAIDFRSTIPFAGTAYVTLEVNELHLSASIDFRRLTAALDAQMSGQRRVPELTESDSELLAEFSRALNSCVVRQPVAPVDALLRVSDLWAEWPAGLSLSRNVAVTDPLTITMLCSKAKCTVPAPGGGYVLSYTGPCAFWNWHLYSNHDCNQCENNEPNCQQRAQLGDHYYCNGPEWFWNGSQWVCGEPNHWNRPYIVGNCIGRCGPGCGWRKQYTKDCTNHDTCIRNGHADWSPYCNDEFALAIDDFLFAGNCY